ncbi:MAG: TIGR03936 family radical SAM-associated protein [Propionibacteriaceae bacterium]|nr:TIGR03936 family radical SAM-associated protein [Propionibacteriaceae bacterium]
MQRLLLRYTKQGTARFASHRDFTRAFERALRRAGIPMALSSGFNPHPRISYLNAAPTGAASLAEYVEIGLSQEMDADDVTERLNAALPYGFQIAAAGPGGTPVLEASLWRLDIDVAPEILPAAAEWLLAQESVKVTRETKNGPREFEIRDAVKSLAVVGGHLEAVVAMGSPLVRPDDIVAGMGALLPASAPPVFTRLAQGQLVDGQVVNPL